MLNGRKLALTLAFTVLMIVAFGAGCRGFFQNPTIASFVISPTNPTVPLGGTQQMSAFGTDSTGQPTGDITSKITWSSSPSSVISITTGGLMMGKTLSSSPVTITGSYQALPAQTTTASVCVEGASTLTIAPANFTDSTGATSESYTANANATVGGVATNLDITASVQWTTTNTTVVTIGNGTDPAIATINPPATGQPNAVVGITATYTCNATTLTGTTNLTVNALP